MKIFLTLILACFTGFCFAQKFDYPTITQTGTSLKDFIPKGWTILASATGDLNKDGLPDMAVILQHTDSVTYVETIQNNDTMSVVTQPRILLVFFKSSQDNKLHLAEQNNNFVLLHDSPTMEEPFQEIRIEKGILQIDYQLFCNMGCWDITNITYKFRYQANEFALIGADYDAMNRVSHASTSYSYNFLSKKRYRNISKSEGYKGKSDDRFINITALKTLKTLNYPLTWQVEKDFWL